MAEPEVLPEPTPTPEPEPEGVIDIQGRKMVPVDALIAARKTAAENAEQKVRAEYEPLKTKAAEADRLAADLAALRPKLDYLARHPELTQEPAKPDVPSVSDEEAEKYARQYELYTPTGLDLTRAKRIIADNRAETRRIATEAAQQAVQPYAQTTATAQSRQNFVWAASQRGADGGPLVDPQHLAQMWAEFPAELSANPEVARVILDAAVGASVRQGKRPQRAEQEPLYTEVPGGRAPGEYRASDMERKIARNVGMSDKQWTDAAKQYQPDAVNILGD